MKLMVDYFYQRVQNVIIKYSVERHWSSVNEETGGMNDVLYQLYTITVSIMTYLLFPSLIADFLLGLSTSYDFYFNLEIS